MYDEHLTVTKIEKWKQKNHLHKKPQHFGYEKNGINRIESMCSDLVAFVNPPAVVPDPPSFPVSGLMFPILIMDAAKFMKKSCWLPANR